MNMYFIALLCPEEINSRVLKWKLWMHEKFGCEVALRSPAHITLAAPCWMDPELENDLVRSIATFSGSQPGFPVQLSGFSNFKPKVIFIDVVRTKPLDDLYKGLHAFLATENKYPFKQEDRPFHPHVTIATRDLHKKSFYEAWDVLKGKKYEAEWIVAGISLLRHNKKNWDVVATSQFK